MSNHLNEPLVFLSFAGPDRPMAEKLGRDLAARGFDAFIDAHSIEPGENLLVAINKALTDSSYFILLWSRHTDRRSWVEQEYTAALARDLNTRRSFFFIVRLDESPVPWILATRKYLDAFASWEETVAKLTATWNRDRALGPNVFPAPVQTDADRSGIDSVIELRIRNKALSVSHVMKAPQDVTGPQLSALVSKALNLPRETVSKFGGLVTARFTYELRYDDRPLPDEPLTELGLDDGSTVDLLVRGEFGSDGQIVGSWTFRDGQPPGRSALSPQLMRSLIAAAFDHLRPELLEGRETKMASSIYAPPGPPPRGSRVNDPLAVAVGNASLLGVAACRRLEAAEARLATGLTGDTRSLESGFGTLESLLADPDNEKMVEVALDGFLGGLPTKDSCQTVAVTDWLHDRQPTRNVLDRSAGVAARTAPAALVSCGDDLMAGGHWQIARDRYRQLLSQYPGDARAASARAGARKATLSVELADVRRLLAGPDDQQPRYCSTPAKYEGVRPYGSGTNRALFFGNTKYTGRLPASWRGHGDREARLRRHRADQRHKLPQTISYTSYVPGFDPGPPPDEYVNPSTADVRAAFSPVVSR